MSNYEKIKTIIQETPIRAGTFILDDENKIIGWDKVSVLFLPQYTSLEKWLMLHGSGNEPTKLKLAPNAPFYFHRQVCGDYYDVSWLVDDPHGNEFVLLLSYLNTEAGHRMEPNFSDEFLERLDQEGFKSALEENYEILRDKCLEGPLMVDVAQQGVTINKEGTSVSVKVNEGRKAAKRLDTLWSVLSQWIPGVKELDHEPNPDKSAPADSYTFTYHQPEWFNKDLRKTLTLMGNLASLERDGPDYFLIESAGLPKRWVRLLALVSKSCYCPKNRLPKVKPGELEFNSHLLKNALLRGLQSIMTPPRFEEFLEYLSGEEGAFDSDLPMLTEDDLKKFGDIPRHFNTDVALIFNGTPNMITSVDQYGQTYVGSYDYKRIYSIAKRSGVKVKVSITGVVYISGDTGEVFAIELSEYLKR